MADTMPKRAEKDGRWQSAIAAYLDEVSMVAADQFLQCDVRMRQGKMKPESKFGGLAFNVCGDFLQLPPVDKDGSRTSLARPLDDRGAWDEECGADGCDVGEEPVLKKEANVA